MTDYRIVKVRRRYSSEGQQDGRPLGSIEVSAYLDKAHTVGFRRERAIIKERTTLEQVYAAAGAKVRVESDFPVDRFTCLVGQVPSFGIAQLLQEEGGAIYWTGRALRFARLADLVRQEPITQVSADEAQAIESEFLERHEVPWFYSVGDDGSLIAGNRTRARASRYTSRKNPRVLQNMTRCLVKRRVLTSLYSGDINAGAAIQVGAVPHVILTAAHVIETIADGGSQNTYSKFWLGALEE